MTEHEITRLATLLARQPLVNRKPSDGEARLRVLVMFQQLERELGMPPTVREVAAVLELRPSTVHHHLRKLRAAGELPPVQSMAGLRRELAAARAEIARLQA